MSRIFADKICVSGFKRQDSSKSVHILGIRGKKQVTASCTSWQKPLSSSNQSLG
jgi:hypothetical protein